MSDISIAIISVFKNESHILEEWIEHHLKEGISHFFLVDNGSNDNYLEKIQIYIDKQIVTLIIDEKKYSQLEHLNKFLPICKTFDWILVIDLDEIVYSRNGYKTITDYLKSLNQNILQVSIPWKIFGSNNHKNQPSSVINSFTYRDEYPNLGLINNKCITRGNNIKYLRQHASDIYNNNGIIIDSNGIEHNEISYVSKISEEILNNSCLHLNHYVCQSWEYFSNIKMTRGDVCSETLDKFRNENYFVTYDKNNILDDELKNKVY
jgi:hypothetical protein